MSGVEFGRPWCVNRKRQFIQEGSRDADERAIEGILQQLETAWNRYDSMSFAMAFTEDANFIQIFGGQLDGRAAIQAAHRHIFETIYKGSPASFVLRSIRFLRPDVAVVFSRAHVKFKEGNEGRGREIETRPTLIVVKEQGKWQIVEFGGQFRNDWDRRLALAALWVRRNPIPDRARD